ncbi:hypothetical protein FSP39_018726 [Pinctada imbricata]|uniref:B-related factor 1 n=1 Tax=Pinctada imbricata TaxID=66713 RepID=A0AA89C3T6_PINIB|nr:hypothetical protein FSP39_018726 [Pinctada imbricata]
MSSKAVCNQCGCTDIDTDPARGDAVCTNCGSVLEDQIIVSEIQFEEHATGASSVIGQFVSSDGTKSHSLGISFPHGMKKESRTVTLDNDPCLYVARFAHKLEFGDKTHEVAMTALRLVSRMKRDWMHTGRRPSGLCGAALIVAARMHDFARSVNDLVRVVKVCDTTIRKRLSEFSLTASSQLTIEEFQKIDLEEEADPPSFTASKLKAQKAKLAQLEEQNKLPDLENAVTELQREIEDGLEPAKPRGPYAGYARVDEPKESSYRVNEAGKEEENVTKFIEEETLTPYMEEGGAEVVDREKMREKLIKPVHVALGINTLAREVIKEDPKEKESEPENDDGEIDLTGIDDDELEKQYLLTDDEIIAKTKLWMNANAEYLKEQKEKEERLAREKEEEAKNPEKFKPKKTRKKRKPIQAATAEEAIVKLLHEKKISNKINYDVLNDLKGRGITPVSTPIKETPFILGGNDSNRPPLNRYGTWKCKCNLFEFFLCLVKAAFRISLVMI